MQHHSFGAISRPSCTTVCGLVCEFIRLGSFVELASDKSHADTAIIPNKTQQKLVNALFDIDLLNFPSLIYVFICASGARCHQASTTGANCGQMARENRTLFESFITPNAWRFVSYLCRWEFLIWALPRVPESLASATRSTYRCGVARKSMRLTRNGWDIALRRASVWHQKLDEYTAFVRTDPVRFREEGRRGWCSNAQRLKIDVS